MPVDAVGQPWPPHEHVAPLLLQPPPASRRHLPTFHFSLPPLSPAFRLPPLASTFHLSPPVNSRPTGDPPPYWFPMLACRFFGATSSPLPALFHIAARVSVGLHYTFVEVLAPSAVRCAITTHTQEAALKAGELNLQLLIRMIIIAEISNPAL